MDSLGNGINVNYFAYLPSGETILVQCYWNFLLAGLSNCFDVLPIYIGDDRTDEDAFRVLREKHDGFGILVSAAPKETSALYMLKDPTEVRLCTFIFHGTLGVSVKTLNHSDWSNTESKTLSSKFLWILKAHFWLARSYKLGPRLFVYDSGASPDVNFATLFQVKDFIECLIKWKKSGEA